jgi:GT2 family glycosyltransferase
MLGKSCIFANMSKAYIIILNYNNWPDTLECLESVYKSDYKDFTVVVVDNCSTDRSVEKILQWASGGLSVANGSQPGQVKACVFPEIGKPLPVKYLKQPLKKKSGSEPHSHTLVLIEAKDNKGFAAGNNIGLRYALKDKDADFFWLLNNDTVVAPNALRMQVEEHSRLSSQGSKVGILGSKLMHYYTPEKIQYAGGAFYSPWTGRIMPLTKETPDLDVLQKDKLFYAAGASMFVSRPFLEDVGLLEKKYFLYYEELDWTLRAKKKGYSTGYVPTSVVYHKEGSTITGGADKSPAAKSQLADYCALRSRLLFTRKFFPQCLPTIYMSFGLTLVNRIRRKQTDRIPMLLKVLLNPTKPVKDQSITKG